MLSLHSTIWRWWTLQRLRSTSLPRILICFISLSVETSNLCLLHSFHPLCQNRRVSKILGSLLAVPYQVKYRNCLKNSLYNKIILSCLTFEKKQPATWSVLGSQLAADHQNSICKWAGWSTIAISTSRLKLLGFSRALPRVSLRCRLVFFNPGDSWVSRSLI